MGIFNEATKMFYENQIDAIKNKYECKKINCPHCHQNTIIYHKQYEIGDKLPIKNFPLFYDICDHCEEIFSYTLYPIDNNKLEKVNQNCLLIKHNIDNQYCECHLKCPDCGKKVGNKNERA